MQPDKARSYMELRDARSAHQQWRWPLVAFFAGGLLVLAGVGATGRQAAAVGSPSRVGAHDAVELAQTLPVSSTTAERKGQQHGGVVEEEGDDDVPESLAPEEVLGWLRGQAFNRRTEEALAGHPMVKAAEAGTMPLAAAQLVLLEEYSIETSDLRSMALALARHGSHPAAEAFFQASVDGEEIARKKLVDTAHALGLSPAELAAYEPMPTAHAYTAYLAELSGYGGMAAIAAGFAVNFPAYGRMCGRIGRALVSHYNLTEPDIGFFAWFAATVPGFDESATAVIAEGMRQGETLRQIRRGVRLLQGYEVMFWDSVWAKGTARESLTVALRQ